MFEHTLVNLRCRRPYSSLCQISRCFGFSFVGALRGGGGESTVSARACISDTRVDPISGSVYPRTIGMYARLSLCACVNENDGEKECSAEMNERNNIYSLKSPQKNNSESICGAQSCFCGAAPHIGLCMGNTEIIKAGQPVPLRLRESCYGQSPHSCSAFAEVHSQLKQTELRFFFILKAPPPTR